MKVQDLDKQGAEGVYLRPFVPLAPQAQNTCCMRQLLYIANCTGKSPFVFTQLFLRSVIFQNNSLYTQTVAYTTYFELGEPVLVLIVLILQ